MKVTARFYGYIRQALGVAHLEVMVPEGSTLADLTRALQDEHDGVGRFLQADARGLTGAVVVVGGRLYPRTEWGEAPLRDNMVIEFLPPAMGGGED